MLQFFTIVKTWKEQVSIDGWINKEVVKEIAKRQKKKEVVVCTYGILLSHKKWGNSTICNNIDGTWRHYAKWNKSDKERQIVYDLIYMWN